MSAVDAAARERALDVTTSFHVQAPAGSGKTELLVQRLLALLATVERPDAILAITFTRKAAGEMAERVADAFGPLRSMPVDELPAHRRLTRALADRVYEHAQTLGWPLPDTVEQLNIMTLDALHRQLAMRAPLTSRLALAAEPVSGPAATEVYRRAALRLLERLPSTGDDVDCLNEVIAHFDHDIEAWLTGMAALLETREHWLPLIGVVERADTAQLRATIEDALAHFVATRLEACDHAIGDLRSELDGALQAAADRFAALTALPDLMDLATHAAVPPPSADALQAWRGLARLLLTDKNTPRKTVNAKLGFPPGDRASKDRFSQLLADFATQPALIDAMIEVRGLPPCRFEDPQWQAAAALFELLPHLVVELQFEFQASGVVDYAELARAGRAALASDDEVGDAALALDFRLQHVLIDEMQDTSVSQYVLLERLTAGWSDGDGRTVFVVGDPMQSIYRFRQADVGRFVRLRETGLPTVPLQSLQLTTNFRSDPAIVAWCNETFANVFPPRDNERAGAVRFQASSAARRAAAEAGVAVHPLVDAAATDEAACVAAIVADELARGCQDIAILVRARAHVAALTSALAERAIDHTAVEIDRLLDSEIGARLHALTCALLHDADRLAWLGVLRQPPFGLSLAELRDLTINDRDTPVRVLLADPDRRRRLPADRQALIERFTEKLCAVRAAPRASLAERVERLWLEFDGPDWVSDDADLLTADAYFDALRDTAPTDVVLDPVALTQRLLDARSSNYGNTDSRVQVLTMHKAKGLEFDSVILPGLGRAGGTDRAAPLNWLSLADDRDGAVLLALQATRRSEERDPQHAFVARVGQAQVANERLRLLYVACTRARERLHLVGSVARDRRGQSRPAARSLLDALWPALAPRYADIDAPARESGADVAPWLQPGTLRATASQRRVSPHALPEAPAALLPVPLAEAVEYCWAGNTARIVGTAVHRWLDLLAQRGSLEAAQAWYEAQHSAVRAEMAETGLRGRALDAAVQRFNAAVRRSLADERGRWVLFGPHRRSATELAVTGMIDGTLRNVVLDRCFETRDGEHWIVDYKTSSHEGGAIETFLAQEVERYRPQLDGYRQVYAELTGAVPRTALYYPLLGRFIEVSV